MRPKNDRGLPLARPCDRLPEAPMLRQAAYIALCGDARSAMWTAAQKLTIANKVIDYVVDGDAIPKRFYARDEEDPANHALIEMFGRAVDAVKAAR